MLSRVISGSPKGYCWIIPLNQSRYPPGAHQLLLQFCRSARLGVQERAQELRITTVKTMLIKNISSHLLRRARHLRGRGGVGLRLRLDVPQPHRVQIPNLQRCEHCISTYPGVSVISIILFSATLDLRSFSARLDSASRSLEAASSSWRLAMLSSGTSSLWVLTS